MTPAVTARRSSVSLPPVQALLAWLLLALPLAATAHDVGEMEKNLGSKEPYVQIVHKPAPAFDLVDAGGNRVSLADFRGKATVLYFLYARCRDECPLHSLKIAEVQQQIAEAKLGDQIQFVAIATDTEDAAATAELMRAHPGQYGIDTSNWVFLYGGEGRVTAGQDLARAYALEFTQAGEGVQVHGVVTHVIDPEGVMRARYHGLDFDPLTLTTYAAAIAHGEHAPPGTSGRGPEALNRTELMAALTGILSLIALAWVAWTFRRGKRAGRNSDTDADNSSGSGPIARGE